MTGGDLVALYDAEDMPHPMQLAEAWQRFRESGPDLAVVQAPLEISNRGESSVARMFAFEYAALFRGLLPWLSRPALLLPAGRHLEPFPPRGAGAGRRMGPLPRHRGRRSWPAAGLSATGPRPYRAHLRAGSDPARHKLPQRTRQVQGWANLQVHSAIPSARQGELGLGSFW